MKLTLVQAAQILGILRPCSAGGLAIAACWRSSGGSLRRSSLPPS